MSQGSHRLPSLCRDRPAALAGWQWEKRRDPGNERANSSLRGGCCATELGLGKGGGFWSGLGRRTVSKCLTQKCSARGKKQRRRRKGAFLGIKNQLDHKSTHTSSLFFAFPSCKFPLQGNRVWTFLKVFSPTTQLSRAHSSYVFKKCYKTF